MPIRTVLEYELCPNDSEWLRDALASKSEERLEAAFADATRRLGSSRWQPADEHGFVLEENHLDWLVRDVTLDEIARGLVFARAVEITRMPVALAEEWYARGGVPEKRSIVRALALLPKPKLHVQVALVAAFSPHRDVAEAIILDNPYPAQFFSDLGFYQLVEQAIALRFPLDRVIGLQGRMTKGLSTLVAAARTRKAQPSGEIEASSRAVRGRGTDD